MAMWFAALALLLLLPMLLSVWAVVVSQAAKRQRQQDQQQIALLRQRIALLEQHRQTHTADNAPAMFMSPKTTVVQPSQPPLPKPSEVAVPVSSHSTTPHQAAPTTLSKPTTEQAAPSVLFDPTLAAEPELDSQPKPKQTAELEPDEQSVGVVTSLWRSVMQWFSGGNAIVRVGVLVLLVGVVLLLRLAVDVFTVPIELRLGLVASGGVALTLLGLRLRHTRYSYAMSLQGAGLAVVYLTLFAAYRLYAVLPSELTFGLLAVLAVVSAGLALLQNALPLALLAFGAAFLAPLLTATGSNQVVALFSYYLLLNVALAWMAHYRTWRVLNLLGVVMTFGLAGYWGLTSYDASQRWQLEILLVAHMALYVFIAVRYSQQLAGLLVQKSANVPTHHHKNMPMVSIDSTVLFGVPLMGFSLQAGLLHDVPMLLALSSGLLSALYLALAYYLIKRNPDLTLLTEGILALAIGFMALVLPLALNMQWTVVGWSVQGTALVWLGVRQQRVWTLRFGIVLQLLSLLLLGWLSLSMDSVVLPLLIVALGLLLSAYLLRQDVVASWGQVLRRGSFGLLLLAAVVSCLWIEQALSLCWPHDGWRFLSAQMQTGLSMLCFALLGLLFLLRHRWFGLLCVVRLVGVLLSVQVLMLWWHMLWGLHATVVLGVFGVAYAVLGVLGLPLLARYEQSPRVDQALWFMSVLLLLSAVGLMLGGQDLGLLMVVLPLAWVLMVIYLPSVFSFMQAQSLLRDVTPLLSILAVLWLVWVSWLADGQLWRLPYVPLFNGLDIVIAAMLCVLWLLRVHMLPRLYGVLRVVFGLVVFWVVTGVLIRCLHQWMATPLWLDGAWHNGSVHSALTLLWTLLALLLTGVASRFAWREVWLAGGALLVLVVLKLLLVDLSNAATMARILSFIGAGLIMLLIGYIAPLPPSSSSANHGKQDGL